MVIDSQIAAAVIGGLATVAAAVIGWLSHEKKSNRAPSVAQKRTKSDSGGSPTDKASVASYESESNIEQAAEHSASSLSKITVKDIVETINSAPPFQQGQIAKQYNGIRVKWTGHLRKVMEDPYDRESVRVNLTINQDTVIGDSFWFSEKVAKFPEIRTLGRGSSVSVVGEILSASGPGLCVDLKPISIEVLNRCS